MPASDLRDLAAWPDEAHLDTEALWRRGVARRRRRQAVQAGGAAAVIGAAVVALPLGRFGGGSVVVDPGSSGQASPATPSPVHSPAQDDGVSGWSELTEREAVDRLVALAAEHPNPPMPPPAGTQLVIDDLYVVEEDDPSSEGDWYVNSSRSEIDRNATGARRWGIRYHDVGPFDDGSATARALVAAGEPALTEQEQLGAPFEDGQGSGYSFLDPSEAEDRIRELPKFVWEGGGLDPSYAAFLSSDPAGHRAVLELFRETEGIVYTGVTTDLRGREAVGFTAPLAYDAEAEATVLYSIETGQPIGWEYGGPHRDWRLSLTEYSLIE